MGRPVHTQFEIHQPWILLELTDGRFQSVQFGGTPDGDHEGFLDVLQTALNRALARHDAEVLASLRAGTAAPASAAHEEIMAFVRQQLAQPADTVPVARTWFPERADGRDPSGQVHVSLVGSVVAALDVPVGMLERPQRCGWAIRDALNQALERHDDDVAEYVHRRGADRPPDTRPGQPDWEEMTRRLRRLRGGY